MGDTSARIKKKRTKRVSPYSGTEIWDREELFTIIKYEPEIRNKAILALLWDLDARNHEITSLKIGNIRHRERYAEGEIPYNTKTGGGPIWPIMFIKYFTFFVRYHVAEANILLTCRCYEAVRNYHWFDHPLSLSLD